MTTTRKYIKNKQEYREDTKNGLKRVPCEEVLGSFGKVQEFAIVYKNLKEDLELVETAMLTDFVTTQEFNNENLRYLKAGLYMISDFFKACDADVENKQKLDAMEEARRKEQ